MINRVRAYNIIRSVLYLANTCQLISWERRAQIQTPFRYARSRFKCLAGMILTAIASSASVSESVPCSGLIDLRQLLLSGANFMGDLDEQRKG
jgi:hypothetical protein